MVTKGYGFTVEDINGSCPADLEPYARAYQLRLTDIDEYVWGSVGVYVRDVLTQVLDGVLNGKQATSTYTEKSIMSGVKEQMETEALTPEEQHQKLLDEWVRQKNIDKINFDLWKLEQEKNK